jgi:hypothetical protein
VFRDLGKTYPNPREKFPNLRETYPNLNDPPTETYDQDQPPGNGQSSGLRGASLQ